MKHNIILICSCVLSFSVKAQVKVITSGNVAIGSTATPQSKLSVGFSGMSTYLASFKTSDTNSGIYLRNTGPTGLSIRNETINNSYSMTGIDIDPLNLTASYAPRYGITSYGAPSSIVSVGVAGGVRYNGGNSNAIYTGIFGTTGSINAYNSLYKGTYAGYFEGDTRVTGTLYATVLTPSGNSSCSYGNNVSIISSDTDGSVTEKLSSVQMVTLNRHVESQMLKDMNASVAQNNDFEFNDSQSISGNEDNEEETKQTVLSSTRFGLAAEQLRAVYPELVYEDESGNISINYIEMIPLLVQSISELNNRVMELEGKDGLDQSRKKKRSTDIKEVKTSENMDLFISQNFPNPFSESTAIEVNIPEKVSSATLFIYDMSGKQIDKIQINDRGKSSISVSGTSLQEGMYLYSLIADGKVIDTRKMILTK